jgi:hypothetical protein
MYADALRRSLLLGAASLAWGVVLAGCGGASSSGAATGLAHSAAATSESAAAIIATISATGTPCPHVTQTGADTPADRPSCTVNGDPVWIFAPSGGAPGASVSTYISACDYATARGHMRIAIVEDARPTWFIAMPTAAAAATLAADLHARSAGPVTCG